MASSKPDHPDPDRLPVVLPDAFAFVLMPFVLLHLVAGWSYYLDNLQMSLSAAAFVTSLLVVWRWQVNLSRARPALIDTTQILRLRQSWLPVSLGLVALGWHGFVYAYLQVHLGYSAEEARIMQASVFSGFLMLPMYALSLTGFALVCLRQASRSGPKRRVLTLDTLLIALIIAAVFANWTRALLAQYVWVLVLVWYVMGRISLRRLALFGVAILIGMAWIKLARYILADDALTLDYYRSFGAFDAAYPWRSLGNFLLIHLNDNPWRAYMTFEYVPDRYGFQYGRSTFFDFVTIAPGQQFNPNVGLSWYVMNGPLVEREFPPTLLAQGWFDFGFFGAILYAVLYPVLMFVLWRWCHARPSLLRLAILSFFIFNLVIGFYGAPGWLFFLMFSGCFWGATRLAGIKP